MKKKQKTKVLGVKFAEETLHKLHERAQLVGRTIAGHVRWLVESDLAKEKTKDSE